MPKELGAPLVNTLNNIIIEQVIISVSDEYTNTPVSIFNTLL